MSVFSGEKEGAAARARLRARGWALLSALAARGPAPDLLPVLRAVPTLAAALPEPLDIDHTAAQHYEVFGLTVPAAQSLFLEVDSPSAGTETQRVYRSYAATGYEPPPGCEADSLAAELALLARLSSGEAGAWSEANSGAARRLRAMQRVFLTDHLLRWLPPLCEALERQAAFYAAVAGLLAEFAAEHAGDLDAGAPDGWQLPAAANLVADPATRLDDLVTHLLLPARCGFLLDRAWMRAAGRAAELPVPFGDRRLMLTSLLRAAGEFEKLAAVLDALEARAALAIDSYAAAADDLPAAAPWWAPWRKQADATRALIRDVRQIALG